METDIGNPIEYDPTIDNIKDDKSEDHDLQQPQQVEPQYYYEPQQQQMMYPDQMAHQEKFDILSSVDKSTWIIAFAVFLLGFFMGKTMQPVILRYS